MHRIHIEKKISKYSKSLTQKKFLVENKNYALFNYVNELNNQVELLQEQIDQVIGYFLCLV